MSLDILKNMLIEEVDRKDRALAAFNDDIIKNNRMPIYFKKIKSKEYIYINDGEKGNFHYKLLNSVNSLSKQQLEKLMFNSDKYYSDIESIKHIKEDKAKLERMIKIIG